MDRRTWAKLTAAGTLAAAAAVLPFLRPLRIRVLPVTDRERGMLARLVDLLVPRDETPGAIDLGVHRSLLAGLEGRPQAARGLAYACLLLDRLSRAHRRADFLDLDEPAQSEVLSQAFGAQAHPVLARTLRNLRRETLTLYYARPESWPGLGIDAPPQPLGYPGYADAPAGRT
jgi:hypothetical protein